VFSPKVEQLESSEGGKRIGLGESPGTIVANNIPTAEWVEKGQRNWEMLE
jgi:hypothetical protein